MIVNNIYIKIFIAIPMIVVGLFTLRKVYIRNKEIDYKDLFKKIRETKHQFSKKDQYLIFKGLFFLIAGLLSLFLGIRVPSFLIR